MAAPRTHLPELAAFNVLAILLVVLGHSVPGDPQEPVGGGFVWLTHLIYRFHMPLFWWAAGYLYLHTHPAGREQPWLQLVRQKAARLLIPYLVISSLAFPIKALLSNHALRPVSFTWGSYLESLFYPWRNTIIFFWFLPTLFLVFLFAPVLRRVLLARIHWGLPVLSLVLLGLNLTQETAFDHFLNYRGALRDLWLFWLGMLACHYRPRLQLLESPGAALVSAGVLLALAWTNLPTTGARLNWPGTVGAVAGITLCWAVANRLCRVTWLPFDFLHRWSFTIYLLSWFPQIFFKLVLWQKLGFWWLAAASMFVGGTLLPMVVGHAIVRWLPAVQSVIGVEGRKKRT